MTTVEGYRAMLHPEVAHRIRELGTRGFCPLAVRKGDTIVVVEELGFDLRIHQLVVDRVEQGKGEPLYHTDEGRIGARHVVGLLP